MENYTQVPNYIIDKWMNNMKYYSFITLMAICRKIIGYEQHRETLSDYISLSQLQKLTGLSRATVVKAVKDLEDKEIITVSREGKINKIKFNIDSSCGIPIQNGIVHTEYQGSIPGEPMGSIPGEHTKESIIKKNITKENNAVEDEIYNTILEGFKNYYITNNIDYVTEKKDYILARKISKNLSCKNNWKEILSIKINGLDKKVKENPKFWSFTLTKLKYGWNEFVPEEKQKVDLEFINNLRF